MKSRTRQLSRSNVYSNKGPYVNNPSSKPRNPQGNLSQRGGGFTNFISRVVIQPFRGNGAPSATGNYVTRGRRNVYWGKFRKGEKAITTDISGRPLRAKNYHTPSLGALPTKDPYRGRKFTGDRAVSQRRFPFATRKAERPWIGNVSGNRIRFSRPRTRQVAGDGTYSYNFSFSKRSSSKRLPGSGLTHSRSGKIYSKHIQGKVPGVGGLAFDKFLDKFQGKKRGKLGGGSVSGKGLNNNGRPVQGKAPGIGGLAFEKFLGKFQGRRMAKGGGSVSGRRFSNKGQPIQVREPKFAFDVGAYQGNYRRGPKTFNDEGYGFKGSTRSRRPLKGGGSVSGKLFNNRGIPIQVREPKFGVDVGAYSGNIKGRRPLKGGGSVSGKLFNNRGNPIQVREPKFGVDVGAYSGNIKGRKPLKGGGSISGKLFNNNGNPIAVREPKFAVDVGAYQGNYRKGPKTFSPAGYAYKGNIKASKPLHGGGSVSGKLWNNNNSPIKGRAVERVDESVSRYTGELKLARFKKNYVQNPNANKLALRKQRPDRTTYAVDGLQIKTKEFVHGKNKSSANAAIDVRTAAGHTVKASEYSGKMKLLWSHKHNPHSSKLAMDVRYPGKAIARLKDFQGNERMKKPQGKNLHPDSKFAHSRLDNVKHERTILMNVRLVWAKLFRKSSTQPTAVKEKVSKPRYDKKEKELWKDLYD
jgi:hypothetical protein